MKQFKLPPESTLVSVIMGLTLASFVSLVLSCFGIFPFDHPNTNKTQHQQPAFYHSFKEITYQGCQYLIVDEGRTTEHVIHKGNCSNHK